MLIAVASALRIDELLCDLDLLRGGNQSTHDAAHGWTWCALSAVLFGAATPATKLVVDHVGAVTLAGLLYLGAAAAVAPFALREQRSTASVRQPPDRSE
ncbi:MAG: hypothetical protein JJD93_04175 [Ilumatobacteraceae bacterium]|nr:hypothetical protein [Ilumatobacteraceae bacterium]